MVSCPSSWAQDKNDFNWILGYKPNFPSSFQGGTFVTFSNGFLESSYFNIFATMDSYSVISDNNGNLQFYTDGCNVLSHNHVQMENGNQISPGQLHDYYCSQSNYGYLEYLGLLSLPFPNHPNMYYLFHLNRDFDLKKADLLYSIIDMDENNGLGKVVEKNTFLLQDTFSLTLTAVRHANGRDWWVVAPKENSSVYYFYFLDPQGVHGPYANQPDSNWIQGQTRNYVCLFSPDGSKLVRMGEGSPSQFRIYDFDRCSGTLFNSVTLSLPDDVSYASWAAFSPNSRFLYVTNNLLNLYQYDFNAVDIDASRQLVGTYDGYVSPEGLSTPLFSMSLAPDNKIYMSSPNTTRTLHVIHKPNEPGLACDFRQHDLNLSAKILFYMPNVPHFRLYNLPGSLCDTLNVKTPIVSYWHSEQDSIMGPMVRSFYDHSYYQPVSWLWNFDDGNTDTSQSPAHTFNLPGNYNVCLTACNASNECNTQCREIIVTTVGTNLPTTAKDFNILISPNPTSGEFVVNTSSHCQFRIWSTAGTLIKHCELSEGQNIVSIHDQIAGLYLGECIFETGERVPIKVVLIR